MTVVGIFASGCGVFLLVGILFYGWVPTDSPPYPPWGLWFIAIMFLILGSICIFGAIAGFLDHGAETR
jgi:hypothetical protein